MGRRAFVPCVPYLRDAGPAMLIDRNHVLPRQLTMHSAIGRPASFPPAPTMGLIHGYIATNLEAQ
jgi:hypothetical protein